MKVAITGGIACGKSLLSAYLAEAGIATIDADDIVHSLVPADERRRLAQTVFSDPAARKALEARLHPLVRERIAAAMAAEVPPVAVIPLLFEVKWENDFDIICAVVSSRENQMARMTAKRGYSREEALARLSAQMDPEEKAARASYTIRNDGTDLELREEAFRFAAWLEEKGYGRRRV